MEIGGVIFVILWSILVGYWANRRMRSPFAWFIISLFCTPLISAIILYSIKNKAVKIPCPSCGGLVDTWSSICEHCAYSLATDEKFIKNSEEIRSAIKDDTKNKEEWEEKNRIAGEGYEAFKSGGKKSDNPYNSLRPANLAHISYWDRGFSLAERRNERGESL